MIKKYMAGKIIKSVLKKGRPKVDKRKTRGKRKAQSAARQKTFQEKLGAEAEKAGTSKAAITQGKAFERKAQTIRSKNLDRDIERNAIAILKEDKGRMTADTAIAKAKSQSRTKMQKVMSRARKETASMKKKGMLSGLTDAQKKERQKLITQKLKEMKSEGKTKKVIAGRTLSLTPEGERVLKQKGGIDKILEASGPTGTKRNRFLYEGANETLPAKGGGIDTKGKTGKEAREMKREAYKAMSKSEKLEFIRKQFARGYTNKQLEEIMYQPKTAKQKKAKATIIQRMRNAKNQGYPFKTKEDISKRTYDDIMKSFGGSKITNPTTTTKKSGGKIGTYKAGKQIKRKSSPRGCGAAMRGYGKAMK